jgi:hypothetical protein
MQKKTILSVTLITALLVAAFMLLNATAPTEKKEEPTCKEKIKECSIKNKNNSSGEMIMDNLSRQFISIKAFAPIP